MYIISLFPPPPPPNPPFSPSLISLMVSVDVENHVYLLTYYLRALDWHTRFAGSRGNASAGLLAERIAVFPGTSSCENLAFHGDKMGGKEHKPRSLFQSFPQRLRLSVVVRIIGPDLLTLQVAGRGRKFVIT